GKQRCEYPQGAAADLQPFEINQEEHAADRNERPESPGLRVDLGDDVLETGILHVEDVARFDIRHERLFDGWSWGLISRRCRGWGSARGRARSFARTQRCPVVQSFPPHMNIVAAGPGSEPEAFHAGRQADTPFRQVEPERPYGNTLSNVERHFPVA